MVRSLLVAGAAALCLTAGVVPALGAQADGGLDDPAKKEIAMELVSSAENSSLDWRAQFGYIEDIGDGRGYTGGIIGFCSGTHDMLELVREYTNREPDNILAKYLPALEDVDGTDSHDGLGSAFTRDWKTAADDPVFQESQEAERDRVYFDPAVAQAKEDGLRTLGQFAYYDAIVMHGDGDDPTSFSSIRARAMQNAETPAQGGDEATYLNAFLDARVWAMKQEEAHSDTSRVDTEQRVFLDDGNFDLDPPLSWHVYGDPYEIGDSAQAAAALDPNVAPGGNFDLGIWDLQLPIGSPGSPTTIHSRDLVGADGYSNGAYFWTDKNDGSMTFWDPEKGVTTPNSNYARSELREMNRDGSAANWSLSGTHKLSAELRVVSVTKNVCVGQIHLGTGGSSTKPLIELYYHSNGDVVAGIENSPDGGQTTHTITNVPMGQHWTYTIAVQDNQIKLTVNGNTTTYGIQGDFFAYKQYFKAGDYNQSSSSSTSNGAKVKFYSLNVSHG